MTQEQARTSRALGAQKKGSSDTARTNSEKTYGEEAAFQGSQDVGVEYL